MEKLPPTSYIRMVDIWLITGQLVPFVEVILVTIIELKRDGLTTVNHHGFMRLKFSVILGSSFTLEMLGNQILLKPSLRKIREC